ncbi:MAG: beta-ketoacyl synthase [Chitinophagaceae bacterium]|nr:beta-ketoacyl synthase [Chitinophagaceae bacterium]
MKQDLSTYIIDTSFISPLGLNTNENFAALLCKQSGIRLLEEDRFFHAPILASVTDDLIIEELKAANHTQTRFDTLLMACVADILEKKAVDFSSATVLIILSTTKGNVELLEEDLNHKHATLTASATLLQQFTQNPNPVLIVSNACISGVSASIAAKRYLDSGRYQHVLVLGCDAISRFVLSGFSSFKAVSKNGCRPFDSQRDGVVLGEAAGAILYSNSICSAITMQGGFISNDANHISGPSRTGDELAYCIQQTLHLNKVDLADIDFISAHGTATLYNDEMESKAIATAGLGAVPVFSVKAHLGHTLGASGVVETIISAECLKRNLILPSLGYEESGVSVPIAVNKNLIEKEINFALKTTSGFGGCNAALLLQKK